jgi:uncharacterized protein YbjT (DUF2867 family)
MSSPILVTGGTGTLGGHVIPLLQAAGRDVRILSRHRREPRDGIEYFAADLLEGEGIEPAVAGVETVLHLAGGTKGDDKATQNLVRAAARAGVQHIVHISVIGANTMPLGWFQLQLRAEQAVTESGIPWTMLRAAQFHDLVLKIAEKLGTMPVIPAPGGVGLQPVDSREVAARLAELAMGRPAGHVPDLAGPTVYPIKDLVGGYLQARGKRRMMVPIGLPGKVGKAYRAGANLSLDGAEFGKRTWEEFLAERVSA